MKPICVVYQTMLDKKNIYLNKQTNLETKRTPVLCNLIRSKNG